MKIEDKKVCECDSLKEDQAGFKDWDEFYNFKKLIEADPLFEELTEEKSLYGDELANAECQNWFQCLKCKVKWCLDMPDPPFDGEWLKATWRK